ncbi:hypothetical protein [Sporomusa sp. KB1]|jgi:hypothetical protein|uniref:hypothetical protein n=1 Tax=Sporomusa sp. KB1 TaxID=943346 RepID=UPI001C98D46A|nr:hypothetical protein [Sporomusa sp. KB1]
MQRKGRRIYIIWSRNDNSAVIVGQIGVEVVPPVQVIVVFALLVKIILNFKIIGSAKIEFKSWNRDDQSCCCQPQAAAGVKKAQSFVARRWAAPQNNKIIVCE